MIKWKNKNKRGFTIIEILVGTIIIGIFSIGLVKTINAFNTLNDKFLAKQIMISQSNQIKDFFEWQVIKNKLKNEKENMENISDISTFKNMDNNFLKYWTTPGNNFIFNKGNVPISLNDIGGEKTFKLTTINNKTVFKEVDPNDYNYLGKDLSLFKDKSLMEYIEDEFEGVKYQIKMENINSGIIIGATNIYDLKITIEMEYKLGETGKEIYSYTYTPNSF